MTGVLFDTGDVVRCKPCAGSGGFYLADEQAGWTCDKCHGSGVQFTAQGKAKLDQLKRMKEQGQ